MFAALISYITGGLRIKIRGLNLDRLIASLLKDGFVLRNLKRPSYQVLIFDAGFGTGKKILSAVRKQNYEVSVLKEYGLPGFFKKLAPRMGLFIGLILCVAGVAVYNGYVWDIKVDGIERIKKTEVSKLLTEMGVKNGMAKKSVDRDVIALTLNTKLNDAANVTVLMKGTSLIIKIYETIFEDEVPDQGAVRDIVSAYDAIITKVVTLNGTALVKPGDIVKKGAVLIAGYNTGADGTVTGARADGEITGKVFFSADNVFFIQREEYIRTGNYAENTFLDVAGLSLGIKKAANPYSLYEKEVTRENTFTNMFIPCKITRERYYELAAQTAEYDYETVKESVISGVKARAEAQVPKAAVIVDAKTDIRQIDKYVITMYNIEAVMQINA